MTRVFIRSFKYGPFNLDVYLLGLISKFDGPFEFVEDVKKKLVDGYLSISLCLQSTLQKIGKGS